MLRIEHLTNLTYQEGLEPEYVLDNTFISRAFNSSQTYDLVMSQLDSFFERVLARLLLLSGLAEIYYGEGLNAEGMQYLTHLAYRLITFSVKHGIATIITGRSSPKFRKYPAAGHAILHCAHIHVYVEPAKERVVCYPMKHPNLPSRSEQEEKPRTVIVMPATLSLSLFIDGLE